MCYVCPMCISRLVIYKVCAIVLSDTVPCWKAFGRMWGTCEQARRPQATHGTYVYVLHFFVWCNLLKCIIVAIRKQEHENHHSSRAELMLTYSFEDFWWNFIEFTILYTLTENTIVTFTSCCCRTSQLRVKGDGRNGAVTELELGTYALTCATETSCSGCRSWVWSQSMHACSFFSCHLFHELWCLAAAVEMPSCCDQFCLHLLYHLWTSV